MSEEIRMTQVKMPERPVEERLKDFEEVALGYSEEEALAEAARCLLCSDPGCVAQCPIEVDIPGFVRQIRSGDYSKAAEKIREVNWLPAICGRFCPQEDFCLKGCWETTKIAPINIGALERFVADWDLSQKRKNLPEVSADTGKSVAVVGGGPAGLTSAAELRRRGHRVVIFEALHEVGGVLRYGIPGFRLPKKTVRLEVDFIEDLGVEMKTNMLMGRSMTVDDLFNEGFDSIIIATGAGLPTFFGLPGENLCGILSSNEFLIRTIMMNAPGYPSRSDTPVKAKGVVTVVGPRGVDSARCAVRLGADEVHVFFGWTLTMRADDIRRAREEGIKFHPYSRPLEFLGDEKRWVKQLRYVKNEIILNRFGRKHLAALDGTSSLHDTDVVVIARGQYPNTQIARLSSGIQISDKSRTVIVNPQTYETTRRGIYAIGDVATGTASAIEAMEAGRKAAGSVDSFISPG